MHGVFTAYPIDYKPLTIGMRTAVQLWSDYAIFKSQFFFTFAEKLFTYNEQFQCIHQLRFSRDKTAENLQKK